MIRNTHTTDGTGPVKAASEPMTHETPSSFNRRVPSDGDIVRFDPKRCPWNALRDVVYARQNTNMNRLDICKVLKALYLDEAQFQNMSSEDVEKMVEWWKDPAYPYRHRPLFFGSQSYENIGLRLKRALSDPKTPKPLAPAPAKPMRSASPRRELTDIPLPPRHSPPDSIFTTEVSPDPEEPERHRRCHGEAVRRGAVPKARRVKPKADLKIEVTRQQALTLSTNTDTFKIPSNCRSAKPLLQNSKAFTCCGKSPLNSANDYGNFTQSHAEDNSTSDLRSLLNRLPVEISSNVPSLQSKAQSQHKPIKQSLMLAPPPQPIGFYSVKYPELSANYKPNTRAAFENLSRTYWNHSTPPHSPSRSPSSSRPAKRQALGEKPTNVWQRNGAGCEQLPSINSLFPSEHWENLCRKIPTTGPCRIAGQDKTQIIVADQGAYPLNIYGRQDRPMLLPPLEVSTPSIPSLSSSSVVTPTSPVAGRSRMNHRSIFLPNSVTPADFVVRKSYSEGTLKLPPLNHSGSGVRKRCSEGSLKFSPTAYPWHAIRDVAIARDRMNLRKEQIALLLGHRYGTDYPSLKQVTMEQVQELWESSRTCREALYTEQDCGVVEQQLWNDLRSLELI